MAAITPGFSSTVLYDHTAPSVCPFPEGVAQEIDLAMPVISSLMSLQIQKVMLVQGRLFVLLAIQSSGPCDSTIVRARAQQTIYLPNGLPQPQISCCVLNCTWKPTVYDNTHVRFVSVESIKEESAYQDQVSGGSKRRRTD